MVAIRKRVEGESRTDKKNHQCKGKHRKAKTKTAKPVNKKISK